MSSDINSFENSFDEVYAIIQKWKQTFSRQANTILIDTYWSIGRFLSEKVASENGNLFLREP